MQVERSCRKVREWRTGEEYVGYLPKGEEYRREIADNTAYARLREQSRKTPLDELASD
jgi:hypothetical protein